MITFLTIIGVLLLLPIALTLVVGVVGALLGGYIYILLEVCGWLIALVLSIVVIVKLIQHFTKK